MSNQPIIDGVTLNVVVPEAVAINSAITPEPSDGSVPCVLLASAVLAAVSEYILTQHCLSTVTFCNANDLPNVAYSTESETPSAIEAVVSASETRDAPPLPPLAAAHWKSEPLHCKNSLEPALETFK